jgi:hypothetical protein
MYGIRMTDIRVETSPTPNPKTKKKPPKLQTTPLNKDGKKETSEQGPKKQGAIY